MLAEWVSDWTAVSNGNHGVWGKVATLPLLLKRDPGIGHAVPTVRTFRQVQPTYACKSFVYNVAL